MDGTGGRIIASKFELYGRARRWTGGGSRKHVDPRNGNKQNENQMHTTPTNPHFYIPFHYQPHHCCCCPELGGLPNVLLKVEGVLDVPLAAVGVDPNPNAAGPAAPGLAPNVDVLPNGDD